MALNYMLQIKIVLLVSDTGTVLTKEIPAHFLKRSKQTRKTNHLWLCLYPRISLLFHSAYIYGKHLKNNNTFLSLYRAFHIIQRYSNSCTIQPNSYFYIE